MRNLFFVTGLMFFMLACQSNLVHDMENQAETSALQTAKQVESDLVQGGADLANKENTILQTAVQKAAQPAQPASSSTQPAAAK